MKISARFWIILLIVGLLGSMVLPGVTAETFDIGTKVSESDLDLRDRKLVYFDSGTTAYSEPEYIDYLPLIFDGDESTGIDHNFGPDHDMMWIELMFPQVVYVSDIIVKPSFGGGSAVYTLYLNSNGIWSPWMAEQVSTEEIFHINCLIIGIWLQLDNGGTNHFYFNDIIINYTPNGTSGGLGDGSEFEDEDEDDLEIDELFIEPPFIGLLWIATMIALILSLIRRRPARSQRLNEKPESTAAHSVQTETSELSLLKDKKEAGGRFCPNCGKYTEEKGPFCPHCKRSMV